MKGHDLPILLAPPDIAALLQVPESTINAAILFGQAPPGTWTPNRKRKKWRMQDLDAWELTLQRLRQAEL